MIRVYTVCSALSVSILRVNRTRHMIWVYIVCLSLYVLVLRVNRTRHMIGVYTVCLALSVLWVDWKRHMIGVYTVNLALSVPILRADWTRHMIWVYTVGSALFVLILTRLSISLRKTLFFAWRFILNETILFLLSISYQKPFVFSIFCPKKFILKLNLRPNIDLTYAISIVKCFFSFFFFGIFC